VVADAAPSLKSAVAYHFTGGNLRGSAAPVGGHKVALTGEVAGLGGDVAFVRLQAAATLAASWGRYMPDTGFAPPLAGSTWASLRAGSLPAGEVSALTAQHAELAPNPRQRGLWEGAVGGGSGARGGPHASGLATRLTESDLAPAARADLFLASEKGVGAAAEGREARPAGGAAAPDGGADDGYTWRERVAGWSAAGATLVADAKVGMVAPFGSDARRHGGLRPCDRLYMTAASLRGFDSVGPKAARVPGGTPHGDALGGNVAAALTARLLLPPPVPSVRLTNAGVRTQVWASVGSLLDTSAPRLPGASALPPLAAAAGVGIVRCATFASPRPHSHTHSHAHAHVYPATQPLPVLLQVVPFAGGTSLELNYALAHRSAATDVATRFRIQLLA